MTSRIVALTLCLLALGTEATICRPVRQLIAQDGYSHFGAVPASSFDDNITFEGIAAFPSNFTATTNRFGGGCVVDKHVIFSPRQANMFVVLDTSLSRMSGIPTAAVGPRRFVGCVAINSSAVLFAPCSSGAVVLLNPLTKSISATISTGSTCFHGATRLGDYIYLAPHAGAELVRVHAETLTAQTYTNWPSGFVAGGSIFAGAIADTESIWLVPLDASHIVRVLVSNMSMIGFTMTSVGIAGSVPRKFAGGTFDHHRRCVYFAPHTAAVLVRVNIDSGRLEAFGTWPQGLVLGAYRFTGAVYDGRYIFLSPSAASQVVRFDPVTTLMVGFEMWPSEYAYGVNKFDGVVFTGDALYLVPFEAAVVIKVRSLTPQCGGTQTRTGTIGSDTPSVASRTGTRPRQSPTDSLRFDEIRSQTSTITFAARQSGTQTPRFSPTTSASPVGIHSTMTTTLAHSPTLATVAPRGTVVITVERDALSTALGGAGVPAASASTATTVVVGAFVSPTGSTRIPRVAAATSLLRCGLATDDAAAADAKPSLLELPAHPAVGNSARRYYAGGALLAAAGVVAAKLSAVLLSRSVANGVVRVLAAIAAALEAFFAANVCFGAVSVLAQTPDTAGAAAAAVSLILAGGAIGASVWCVNSTSETVNEAVWRPFIEGCRDRRRAAARNFYAAEQLASCAMAAVSAAAGAPSAPCSWMAALLILLMAAYVLYLLLALPYASRVDMTFALLLGALQLALGVTALLQLRGIVGAAVVGWMAIAAYGTSLAQTVVQAAVALWLSERRRTSLDSDTPMLIMSDAEEPTSSSSGSAAAAPVAVPSPVSNPLHHHHHHHHQ